MSQGLPVSRLINVAYTISSSGAQYANVNSALILGSSNVIDVGQRLRSYSGISAVAADFGATAPEYLAAVDFFAATPSPTQLFIGRWAQTATSGLLIGGALAPAAQALGAFTAITSGSLTVTINGTVQALTGLSFAAASNLNAVAAAVTAALSGGAVCSWNGSNFTITSGTTGSASTLAFPGTPGAGTNIATLLGLTQATGARLVAGQAAETAIAAVQALDGLATYFYGLSVVSPAVADADHLAIAAYVQADAVNPHVYFVTTQEAAAPNGALTTDIASALMAAGYTRTFVLYSSTDPYAVCAVMGRMVTVNWQGSKTAINYMYQSLPGIVPESLTAAQASALDAKRCNYCATYANGVAILEAGVMAGPAYLDEITGADWLAGAIQTNVFNLFVGVGTKVAQTDAGQALITNAATSALDQSVVNGLVAPGVWTSGGFGQLALGDFMPTGYYVYQPPIALQSTPDRAARKSVGFQVAAKFAGATDTANVALTFNR
jgi:hypothetical protein